MDIFMIATIIVVVVGAALLYIYWRHQEMERVNAEHTKQRNDELKERLRELHTSGRKIMRENSKRGGFSSSSGRSTRRSHDSSSSYIAGAMSIDDSSRSIGGSSSSSDSFGGGGGSFGGGGSSGDF